MEISNEIFIENSDGISIEYSIESSSEEISIEISTEYGPPELS